MATHYKTRPWHTEIDPSFNDIIKKCLEVFRLVHIPANEGHLVLSLPQESIERITRERYPSFAKFYEKENIRSVFEESQLLFSDDLKDIDFKKLTKSAKKRRLTIEAHIRDLLPCARIIYEEDGFDD